MTLSEGMLACLVVLSSINTAFHVKDRVIQRRATRALSRR